jgi:hypothetical protein
MTMLLKDISRKLKLGWFPLLVLLFAVNCGGGGGGGDPSNGSVRISGSIQSGLIQAEMIKDTTPVTATITVSASATFDNLSASVATVRLDRYELTFSRQGGGVGVEMITGNIGRSLAAPTSGAGNPNLPSAIAFDVVVFETDDKVFSAFAQDWHSHLQPVIFDCNMVIYGHNDAGTNLTTSGIGFQLQADVFQPVSVLAPVIESLTQTTNLRLGDQYFANWRTSQRVDSGLFILPWGDQLFLEPSYFPFGSIYADTTFLSDRIDPGESLSFLPGKLFVSNPFGTDESVTSGSVTVSRAADPPPTPLSIVQFFADRTTIVAGETVNLNWVIEGDPDQLQMLPDAFSGIPVDFSGTDFAFGQITIQPEFTVQPILRASRTDGTFTTAFLREPITVTPIDTSNPPAIEFFLVDRSQVPKGSRVTFLWEVSGGIDRVELLPINGMRIDVTDLNILLGPPLLEDRVYTFTLVAFGTDGTLVTSSVNVNVVLDNNLPIAIQNLVQAPGASIDNDDNGSFSFTVSDPERVDSSYRINKIAGDQTSFFPHEGQIPDGLGDVAVGFDDFPDNDNGFLTFEISAYDDRSFGFNQGSTRAVRLVTFTTTGQVADSAPVITSATFTPSGPEAAPGAQGIINFTFTDPDTLDLRWYVSIAAGDFGGSLDATSGSVDTGSGDISILYNDDPDTPADPVVFLIQVVELGVGALAQRDIELIRVDKSGGDTGSGTTTPTDPVGIPFIGLYANASGGVTGPDAIEPFNLYTDFNGSPATARLFRNPDLSGEVPAVSVVIDFEHNTGDPAMINQVEYSRNFLNSGGLQNQGVLNFVGYFSGPGVVGPQSPTTLDNGVTRWRMTFTAESFRNADTSYNLPATAGTQTSFNVTIVGTDITANSGQVTKTITVIHP